MPQGPDVRCPDRSVGPPTGQLIACGEGADRSNEQFPGGRMDQATYRDTPIPGTMVFTGERSSRGYRINKLAMSLTDEKNRDAFKADERAYMKRFGLSDDEMALIAKRD